MWKSININIQNVKYTDCGGIISMPHNSEYDGYVFWHPSKLIQDGKNSYSVKVIYNDDFTFNLKKYGKGKWNSKKILSEKIIDVGELEESFEEMDTNISAHKKEEIKIHKPEKLEPTECEALEELKDE